MSETVAAVCSSLLLHRPALQVAQGLFPHHPLVFNYMNIQVQDIPSEDLVIFFPKCFEFIDRAVRTGGEYWQWLVQP